MSLVALFGTISTIIALYCSVPYIRAVLNGKTKPHQFSWLVFTILNATTFLSQYFEGARLSVLISLAFLLGSTTIFILSFKYGTRDTSRYDRFLLGFALVTIIVWAITRSNALAIWLIIVIDTAATAMNILKIKAQPHSEQAAPWVLASTAYVFTCLTLIHTRIGILFARPLYGLGSDIAMVTAIYLYRRKTKDVAKVTLSPYQE